MSKDENELTLKELIETRQAALAALELAQRRDEDLSSQLRAVQADKNRFRHQLVDLGSQRGELAQEVSDLQIQLEQVRESARLEAAALRSQLEQRDGKIAALRSSGADERGLQLTNQVTKLQTLLSESRAAHAEKLQIIDVMRQAQGDQSDGKDEVITQLRSDLTRCDQLLAQNRRLSNLPQVGLEQRNDQLTAELAKLKHDNGILQTCNCRLLLELDAVRRSNQDLGRQIEQKPARLDHLHGLLEQIHALISDEVCD